MMNPHTKEPMRCLLLGSFCKKLGVLGLALEECLLLLGHAVDALEAVLLLSKRGLALASESSLLGGDRVLADGSVNLLIHGLNGVGVDTGLDPAGELFLVLVGIFLLEVAEQEKKCT